MRNSMRNRAARQRSLCNLALHFDGATHRIVDTGELQEQAIAGGLDDVTAMFLNFWIGQLAPKRGKRPFLVDAVGRL
jgi:hypothetical protein